MSSKTIVMPMKFEQGSLKIIKETDKKIRKITTTPKWVALCKEHFADSIDPLCAEGTKRCMFSETLAYLPNDSQLHYVADIFNISDLVRREINKKIGGYKAQDNMKNIYCEEKFIDYDFVINLLNNSSLKCFYCKKNAYILYDVVREPRQWTIERLNNSMGHNKDNVEIACLTCNLRRCTMFYERYLITKQLKIVKCNSDD